MIIFRGRISGGEITIFDSGDYRFEGEDQGAAISLVQVYRAGQGPERLRIFVERILSERSSRDVSSTLMTERAGATGPAEMAQEIVATDQSLTQPPIGFARHPALSSTPTLAERGLISSTETSPPPIEELRRRLEEGERQLRELRTDMARRSREERAHYALELAQGLIRARTRGPSSSDGFDIGARASPWDIEQALRAHTISVDYASAIRFAVQAGTLRGHLEELIVRDEAGPRRDVDPEANPHGDAYGYRRPTMVPTEIQRAIDAGLIEESGRGSLVVAGARGPNAEFLDLERQFPGVTEIFTQANEAVHREARRQELTQLLLNIADLILAVAGLAGMLLGLGRLAGSRLLLRFRRAGAVWRGEEAALATRSPGARTGTAGTGETVARAEGRAAESTRGERPRRAPRDYDVGVDRLVRSRHSVGEQVRRSATLREYRDPIMESLRGARWQQIQQRARGLVDAFNRTATSRRGAINNLKGLLQEQILTSLPWFSRTRAAALARVRRINAALTAEQRFTETIHFTSNVRVNGRELSDGIFFARSTDGSRLIVLDIIEAKSRTNWRALYTGSRAQIRRDIQRFLQEAISIEGRVFRHSDGSLRFMSDYGQRQAWTLSIPRHIDRAPAVIERLRAGAARTQVSGAMASDFTVMSGALPDAEARSLAEIILSVFSGP